MKNLDCNQIIIFINLEIIREEDKDNIYIYIYIFVGAIFVSKTKCCTCNLFLTLESHIGKTHSLFLPYKA